MPVRGFRRTGCGSVAVHDTIQYIGHVKRFESYETIGGLFAELTGETLELTVIQRI